MHHYPHISMQTGAFGAYPDCSLGSKLFYVYPDCSLGEGRVGANTVGLVPAVAACCASLGACRGPS